MASILETCVYSLNQDGRDGRIHLCNGHSSAVELGPFDVSEEAWLLYHLGPWTVPSLRRLRNVDEEIPTGVSYRSARLFSLPSSRHRSNGWDSRSRTTFRRLHCDAGANSTAIGYTFPNGYLQHGEWRSSRPSAALGNFHRVPPFTSLVILH